VLAEGNHLRLLEDQGWEMVERVRVSGVVVLVAVTEARRLLLVEQYRRPMRGRVIELPAGLAGDHPGSEHETLLSAAKRELLEETGFAATDWRILTDGPASPGVSNEVLTFFLACRAQRVGKGGGDESEEIVVHEVALEDVESWLEAQRQGGLFVDPKTYAGIFFARAHTLG
jgi:ADP-ribose pyrophosphatase